MVRLLLPALSEDNIWGGEAWSRQLCSVELRTDKEDSIEKEAIINVANWYLCSCYACSATLSVSLCQTSTGTSFTQGAQHCHFPSRFHDECCCHGLGKGHKPAHTDDKRR